MAHPQDDVRLTFRPLRDDVPVSIRLRQLLKFALRSLRLRCVRVEHAADGPEAGPTPKAILRTPWPSPREPDHEDRDFRPP